jgi:penicillin-binding protein 2
MVSYPSYENNRMARFIPEYYYTQLIQDPANPLLNHAVGDTLPAGSVFKLVTAVGALNEGVVTPEQIIDTPPKITVTEKFFANDRGNPKDFVDWNEAGFGQLDFLGGISNSSNVYFYKLGGGYKDEIPEGLGVCRLGTYARALGYGDYPGVGMPEEEKGLIPDPQWKRITHG